MDYHGLAWIIMDHHGLSAKGSKFLVCWGALNLKPHGLSLIIIELPLNFNDYHELSLIICSISKVLVNWKLSTWSILDYHLLSWITYYFWRWRCEFFSFFCSCITLPGPFPVDYHGLSWISIIIDYHELSWIIMDWHGPPWSMIEYQGFTSPYYVLLTTYYLLLLPLQYRVESFTLLSF